MTSSSTSSGGTTAQDYAHSYYNDAHLGGAGEYGWDNLEWRGFNQMLAERIVGLLAPSTTLDVGCAKGMLVQSLLARGVDAHGFDISDHAVESAHSDVVDRLWAASATDPIEGRYDLITCVEVLEHMSPEDAQVAIDRMCAASDRILFSSSPADFEESTHINTQPTARWAAWFAERGYYRRTDADVTFLTPWAILFEKADLTPHAIVQHYETYLGPVAQEARDKRAALLEAHREMSRQDGERRGPVIELDDQAILARHGELVAREHLMGLEAKVVRLENELNTAQTRVKRLRETLEDRDEEIAALRGSRTWKVGRLVTGPLGRINR